MRRSWEKINFESVRNQSALVCNCRHEDLIQLLEVEFRGLMDSLAKSAEPVRDIMSWADKCCERLMSSGSGSEDRGTMSSRSVLIRWGYVTSQVMRDLVRHVFHCYFFFSLTADSVDDSQRPDLRCIPDPETILRVSIQLVSAEIWNLSAFLTVTGLH